MSKKEESLVPNLYLWSKPLLRCFKADMDDLIECLLKDAVRFPWNFDNNSADVDYKYGIITVKIDKKLEKDEECRVPIEVN